MKAIVSPRYTPRRIVTAIALCLASGVSSNFAHAQTQSAVEPLESIDNARTAYVLPNKNSLMKSPCFKF